mgnify:CR=1 FL=1
MSSVLHFASLESATAGLLHTLFQLFISLLMVRFLLPLVKANYFNPICQFIIKITDPLLKPLRRVIPNIGRFDGAVVVLMIALQLLEGWIISALAGRSFPITHLLAYAGLSLIQMLLVMYLVFIIANAILSWFAHSIRHPILPLLDQLTAPVLQPIRRIIPLIGGIDISPLVAIIAIQFLIRLLG